MDCRLKCEKPDEIEFTLTITMKAKDWCELRDQLSCQAHKWPVYELASNINDLLGQARKIYWPNTAASSASAGEAR